MQKPPESTVSDDAEAAGGTLFPFVCRIHGVDGVVAAGVKTTDRAGKDARLRGRPSVLAADGALSLLIFLTQLWKQAAWDHIVLTAYLVLLASAIIAERIFLQASEKRRAAAPAADRSDGATQPKPLGTTKQAETAAL